MQEEQIGEYNSYVVSQVLKRFAKIKKQSPFITNFFLVLENRVASHKNYAICDNM